VAILGRLIASSFVAVSVDLAVGHLHFYDESGWSNSSTQRRYLETLVVFVPPHVLTDGDEVLSPTAGTANGTLLCPVKG
jgi:hypothetical protein